MVDAVRSLLAAAGGHPPSTELWVRLLTTLGVAPASAEQIPASLGTVVRGGAYDASAVGEQLDVWAAGLRLRGESADAEVLAAAAAAVTGVAPAETAEPAEPAAPAGAPGTAETAGTTEPAAPAATADTAQTPEPAEPAEATGEPSTEPTAEAALPTRRPGPRPPSPPPGRRGGPTASRGSGAQPPPRGDATRPQAPQPPAPGGAGRAGSQRPGPQRPGPRRPGSPSPTPSGAPQPEAPDAPSLRQDGAERHDAAGDGADPPSTSPFEDLPMASRITLVVLSVLFLACLVALAVTVAG